MSLVFNKKVQRSILLGEYIRTQGWGVTFSTVNVDMLVPTYLLGRVTNPGLLRHWCHLRHESQRDVLNLAPVGKLCDTHSFPRDPPHAPF